MITSLRPAPVSTIVISSADERVSNLTRATTFPCDSVDTESLNETESAYERRIGGSGACVWTSLRGDWKGVPLASMQAYGAEWLKLFANDLWTQQCLHNFDAQIGRHLSAAMDWSSVFGTIADSVATKPYTNCAVVGNSYALLGSALGTEIDSHSQVFRINWPPLGSHYSRDVGQFTSHMVTNAASINCNQRMPRDAVPICRSSYPGDVITLTKWRLCYRFLQLTYGEERQPSGRTLLISPEWEGALQRMLAFELENASTNAVPAGELETWALKTQQLRTTVSTGLLAVFSAVALCKNVDLYGFDGSSEFVHTYWEKPRVAAAVSDTYLAERQIYKMLHVRKLPQKFSHFPFGSVTFHYTELSGANASLAVIPNTAVGAEGGQCLEGKCSHSLNCFRDAICIDSKLARFSSLERGLVSGAGCSTKLPPIDPTNRVLWNGTALQLLSDSAEAPHLIYGLARADLGDVTRFEIAAIEEKKLGEQAEANNAREQEAVEAQLAGWSPWNDTMEQEKLSASAERAAIAEARMRAKEHVDGAKDNEKEHEVRIGLHKVVDVIGAADLAEAIKLAKAEEAKLKALGLEPTSRPRQ